MLDPADVQAIAWALAVILLPVNLATLVWAMLWSFLMASKVAPPRFLKLYRKELNNPESEGAKAAKQNAMQVADEVSAKIGVAALRAELEPLLRTVEIEEGGKKRTVNALVAQLSELVDAAEMIAAAATVDVVDAEGKPAKGLLGPNLPRLIDQTIKKSEDRLKMRKVRGEDTSAIEEAMVEAEWAVQNPEQAQALGAAHSAIDSLAPVFNWNDKKIKQLHAQAIDLARQGQNLKAFIDRLNGGSLLGGAVSGARAPATGGFNPG